MFTRGFDYLLDNNTPKKHIWYIYEIHGYAKCTWLGSRLAELAIHKPSGFIT